MIKTKNKKLKFTGERMIPEYNQGESFYFEHVLRYNFASQFCQQKNVADIACGSGYGSKMLLENGHAKKVTGIDISSKAIKYASKKYFSNNITFIKDDAQTLKKIEEKFDIIVSFETIEHLKKQNAMIKRFKELLNLDGNLIISTPNIKVYKEGNKYHHKELSFSQFEKLLKKYFKNVRIIGQKYFLSQATYELNQKNLPNPFSTALEIDSNNQPEYFIAICSDQPISSYQNHTLIIDKINNLDFSKGIQFHSDILKNLYEINSKWVELTSSKLYKIISLIKRIK